MRTDTARPIRLADYRPSDYLIDFVDLDIRLHSTATSVRATLSIRANPRGQAGAPLKLDGEGLRAALAELDGEPIDLDLARPDGLRIERPPLRPFKLTIETILDPSANTQLMGLYKSRSVYCTQCEAEGFRRIAYFLDRPDVLSVYTTRIEADRAETPVLLGNGNLVASGLIANGERHFAVWSDPYPKPCYLFAIVGGDLGAVLDRFTTASGRSVELGVYVEHGKEARARYAMSALKRAMRWDEEAFGREYDLDVFNIVAVSDFNMGAMENKGLNIFNDKYVLALPETATDADYSGIEAVVAHEYFHNWTGNRITCRDWFQLCLKEGLTVYRDQEFSSDQRSRAVKRIVDVRTLRAQQFPEDAGPLAHNVRPESYLEINNFYTPTVYEKGAEIVRVLKNAIGVDVFRRGMDLYFARCDGSAATVEDFLDCFAETSGQDLIALKRWYEQAGTPVLRAKTGYDAKARTYSIDFTQWTPPTPGQLSKQTVTIPVGIGLIGADGIELPLETRGPNEPDGASAHEIERGVFCLSGETRRITFINLDQRPVPSLLRNFSAPVRMETDLSEHDLLLLLAYDGDAVNRWQAAQTYATRLIIRSVEELRAGRKPVQDESFVEAIGSALEQLKSDPAFAAQIVTVPGEADIARDIGANIDPDAIHAARDALRASLGAGLRARLLDLRQRLGFAVPYSPDAESAGRRALRNAALDLIAAADPIEGRTLAREQFHQSDNMTDQAASLAVLALIPGEVREKAFESFYQSFANDPLVIDKWFALQATIPEPDTLNRVRSLMHHEVFTLSNPNRLRALVGSFASANPTQFNARGGDGYAFLAEIALEVDSLNPQVAARLLNAFRSWKALEPGRRSAAEAALRQVASYPDLSPDARDIVDRSLI